MVFRGSQWKDCCSLSESSGRHKNASLGFVSRVEAESLLQSVGNTPGASIACFERLTQPECASVPMNIHSESKIRRQSRLFLV